MSEIRVCSKCRTPWVSSFGPGEIPGCKCHITVTEPESEVVEVKDINYVNKEKNDGKKEDYRPTFY